MEYQRRLKDHKPFRTSGTPAVGAMGRRRHAAVFAARPVEWAQRTDPWRRTTKLVETASHPHPAVAGSSTAAPGGPHDSATFHGATAPGNVSETDQELGRAPPPLTSAASEGLPAVRHHSLRQMAHGLHKIASKFLG